MAPREIPRTVLRIIEEVETPPQVSFNADPGVPGGTGNGAKDGVWESLNNSFRPVAPCRYCAATGGQREFRTSSILAGSLIRRVEP